MRKTGSCRRTFLRKHVETKCSHDCASISSSAAFTAIFGYQAVFKLKSLLQNLCIDYNVIFETEALEKDYALQRCTGNHRISYRVITHKCTKMALWFGCKLVALHINARKTATMPHIILDCCRKAQKSGCGMTGRKHAGFVIRYAKRISSCAVHVLDLFVCVPISSGGASERKVFCAQSVLQKITDLIWSHAISGPAQMAVFRAKIYIRQKLALNIFQCKNKSSACWFFLGTF